MKATTAVPLTDTEIVDLLDGKVNADAQAFVDRAKQRIAVVAALPDGTTEAVARFVAEVVEHAAEEGKLRWWHRPTRRCRICDKSAGYYVFKSGPRRGKPNYDRPLTLRGIDLHDTGVYIDNQITLGGCVECVTAALPALRLALADMKVQTRGDLGPSRWAWNQNRRCKECGWEGHEGEMRQLRTLMGDGTYPGGCPRCKAENAFLGPKPLDYRDGFTMTPIAPNG